MALRPAFPSLATVAATLLALALAALLIAPVDAAKPATPGDPDGDGLTNTQEAFWGGDPKDADTDNDGLSDGDEVRLYFTMPNNPDSDDDGYQDGVDAYPLHPHRH